MEGAGIQNVLYTQCTFNCVLDTQLFHNLKSLLFLHERHTIIISSGLFWQYLSNYIHRMQITTGTIAITISFFFKCCSLQSFSQPMVNLYPGCWWVIKYLQDSSITQCHNIHICCFWLIDVLMLFGSLAWQAHHCLSTAKRWNSAVSEVDYGGA
jgi:hypothetical protein